MKINLYVDMDGVLANFNAAPDAVKRFRSEKGFFNKLKPIEPNVRAITQALCDKRYNIYVLTASPHEDADADKRQWLRRHLPTMAQDKVIIMRNGQKKVDFMRTKKGVLLDDYGRNCQEWLEKPNNVAVKIDNNTTITKALEII